MWKEADVFCACDPHKLQCLLLCLCPHRYGGMHWVMLELAAPAQPLHGPFLGSPRVLIEHPRECRELRKVPRLGFTEKAISNRA